MWVTILHCTPVYLLPVATVVQITLSRDCRAERMWLHWWTSMPRVIPSYSLFSSRRWPSRGSMVSCLPFCCETIKIIKIKNNGIISCRCWSLCQRHSRHVGLPSRPSVDHLLEIRGTRIYYCEYEHCMKNNTKIGFDYWWKPNTFLVQDRSRLHYASFRNKLITTICSKNKNKLIVL